MFSITEMHFPFDTKDLINVSTNPPPFDTVIGSSPEDKDNFVNFYIKYRKYKLCFDKMF